LQSTESNVNWKQDALETITIIKALNIEVDLVIVDHYGLDSHWESELRHYTRHLMVIDDLADRPHDCDLLLDQNYYLDMKERYKRLVPDHCVQMLGPDYVLLRDEFLQAANEPRERTGEIRNILVFFGGTDPTEETIKALEAIKELDISEIEINVVVGASNPKCHEIKLMCEGMLNTSFHCQFPLHNKPRATPRSHLKRRPQTLLRHRLQQHVQTPPPLVPVSKKATVTFPRPPQCHPHQFVAYHKIKNSIVSSY